MIDQGGNFWDPIKSTQYFDRRKIILVTRDPRSIFSSMKTRKSLAYPGHNIRIFCEKSLERLNAFSIVIPLLI